MFKPNKKILFSAPEQVGGKLVQAAKLITRLTRTLLDLLNSTFRSPPLEEPHYSSDIHADAQKWLTIKHIIAKY